MKRIHHTNLRAIYKQAIYSVCLVVAMLATGCKKFLEIPLPVDQVSGAGAYSNDAAAAAVLNNIFHEISNSSMISGVTSFPYKAGLYTDELQNASTTADLVATYTNAVQSANTGAIWSYFYNELYAINLAIEGVRGAAPNVLTKKNQWLGEALFLRALMHFYLVNLFGDVPIATSPDYTINNKTLRQPAKDVYDQIIKDLKEAQELLTTEYRNVEGAVTTDRARPNKNAVIAFLARVYLYTKDWVNAEGQAGLLIGNTATYQLEAPAQTFLAVGKEVIWGLAPPTPGNFVRDASSYFITAGKTPQQSSVSANLSPSLVSAFEPGDQRFANWVGVSHVPATGTLPAADYYFALKYKVRATVTTPTEYQMVFRLAEQYLIRAEARAQQNNITGAKADVDTIRSRAGLTGTTAGTTDQLIDAILQERRVELFTEWGNRLLDLRRTNKLDTVMATAAPQKGGAWSAFKQWWPILIADIYANPNLTQTPGYQ